MSYKDAIPLMAEELADTNKNIILTANNVPLKIIKRRSFCLILNTSTATQHLQKSLISINESEC